MPTITDYRKSPLDRTPHGVSMADGMEIVAKVCETTTRSLRQDGLRGTAALTRSTIPDTVPLCGYRDVVEVDGIEYDIKITPHIGQFPTCAAAEIHYDLTLRWAEKPDRFVGFHPQWNVRMAEVFKGPLTCKR